MQSLVYIEFAKSHSTKLKKAIALAKELPNYTETDGKYVCMIDSVREYLFNQEAVSELIAIIQKWKNTMILLFGKEYRCSQDYYDFFDELKQRAGKYSVLFDNNDSVSLGAVTIEKLPLPFVFYPGMYGTFFAFSEDIGEQIYFCECEREAITNYYRLKRKEGKFSEYKDYYGGLGFPAICKEMSKDWNDNPERCIKYKEKICFRCNKLVPKKTYCHPMYGGKFKQHYGWFINQEYYKLGIDYSIFGKINVLPEECTPEIYDLAIRINERIDTSENAYDDESQNLKNELNKAIENIVRRQFGYREIGYAWVSETMLFNIVERLCPEEEIVRHFRPKWLEGLELDIYLPNRKIGIEYQGIQHFIAVEHWGGQKQLEKQKEHDARKKMICTELGVRLICVNYDEPLTEDHIAIRLKEVSNL